MGGQSGAALHPWRRAGGAGRSRGRLGDVQETRPPGADRRPAGRLSCRRHARRPDRQGQGGAPGRAILLRRGFDLRQGRQAARLRPRHLFHRAPAAPEGVIRNGAMPTFTNLGDLIVRDRDLAKVAIVDLGGETSPREFSYAQVDAMANGVARALSRRGFARGDRIAILSANRAEYLAAYYGIMRAGLVAVPVNFKFPQQTIHFIIKDAGARLAFCDPQRRKDCPRNLAAVVFGAGDAEGFDAFLDHGPFDAVVPAEREPAMFLYTSGSTGTPKGVVLSHQSHLWVVQTRLAPGLDRHRYLIAAPLYHMNALALSKLACAAHATVVLLPQFPARAYSEAIGRYRCTW